MENDDIRRAFDNGMGDDFDVSDSEVESRLGVSLSNARRRQAQRRVAAATAAAVLLTGVVVTAYSLGNRNQKVAPVNTTTTLAPPSITSTTSAQKSTSTTVGSAVTGHLSESQFVAVIDESTPNTQASKLVFANKSDGSVVSTLFDTTKSSSIKNANKVTGGAAIESVSVNSARDLIAFDTIGDADIRTLWTIASDGTGLKKLGDGYNPSFSPDGTRLAFLGNGDTINWPIVENLASGKKQQVVTYDANSSSVAPTVDSIDWSPDGAKLVLSVERNSGKASANSPTFGFAFADPNAVISQDALKFVALSNKEVGQVHYLNSTTLVGATMAVGSGSVIEWSGVSTFSLSGANEHPVSTSANLKVSNVDSAGRFAIISGGNGESNWPIKMINPDGTSQTLTIKGTTATL